jgi:hypothetical protein
MDLINQGKGPIAQIWGTNNEIILRQIKLECNLREIDFYDPRLFREEREELKDYVMNEGA